MARIAPNIDLYLYRPVLSDPPIYTMVDLRKWVTLMDVVRAHELLDLKGAMAEKARSKPKG